MERSDITVGPLIDYWKGLEKTSKTVPDVDQLHKIKESVGFKNLKIFPRGPIQITNKLTKDRFGRHCQRLCLR